MVNHVFKMKVDVGDDMHLVLVLFLLMTHLKFAYYFADLKGIKNQLLFATICFLVRLLNLCLRLKVFLTLVTISKVILKVKVS